MSQRSDSPERAPPRTPRRAGAAAANAASPAGAPAVSPGPAASVGSASPNFARTPRSGASPMASPSPPPSVAGFAAVTPAPRSVGGASDARTPRPVGSPGSDAPSSRRGPRVAHRGFLGSPPRTPFRSNAGAYPEEEPMAGAEEGNFLYGTDINEMTVVRDFLKFLYEFRLPEEPGAFYMTQLRQVWEQCTVREKGIKFKVSASHIHEFSNRLYGHLINFPTEVIPIFDRELWNVSVRELRAEPEDIGVCQVQIFELLEKDSKIMRSMNPTDIEKLMSLKGIVIRVSDLMPDMMAAVFRCTTEDCKNEVSVPLSHWAIEEPTRCEVCGSNHSFQVVHNDSTFSDRQVLKLQEPPELVPDGETPQNIQICVFDDLVDSVRPGDRIEVTGIYRASPVRPQKNLRQCSAVYRTYIDAISLDQEKKSRIEVPTNDLAFEQGKPPKLADELDLSPDTNTEEEIKWNRTIRGLAAERDADGKPTIVTKLVQSFAPSIYEQDEVKKGLLVQLFGGTAKLAGQSSKGRCRPEINQLLCGDPSTAKSQLIQYAYKLAPRGVYTSGKGSSAVGLTASINKDPATGELVLESGALVLSDRGLCCIDEFDKMDDNARSVMHEAMEQQTVSVAKAGLVCSLNARCSILASANPKESSYDPRLSVVENIHLPKNLMSRFDFLWLMLDKRDKEMDERLAEHLVSMYSVAGMKKRSEPAITAELFRRYVSFARRWVFPQINDAAAEELVKGYIALRNQGTSRDVITANPRNLESLIRISEALAKMELRETVEAADVQEAIRLVKEATYQAAVDPTTGLIDMEQLIVGKGANQRKREKEIEALLQEILEEKRTSENPVTSVDAIKLMMNERLGERKEQLSSEGEFQNALKSCENQGLCRRSGKTVEAR